MCQPIPDDLMTLTEAARCLPGRRPGKALGVGTLHRWCGRGVRGVRLRSRLVGGHRLTTRTWLAEFLAALNGELPPPRPAASRAAEALVARGA
jgi:hypothetical protein